MRRVIVDFKKLTQDVLDLLVEKYPDGYSDSDIVTFRNAQNELIEAVEVRTDDTDYLVKVSIKLAEKMENEVSDDDDDDDDDNDDDNEFEDIEPADLEEPDEEPDEETDV